MNIQCKASPLDLRSSRPARPNYLAACLSIFICVFLFFFGLTIIAHINRSLTDSHAASSTKPNHTPTPALQQITNCQIQAKMRLTLLNKPAQENSVGTAIMRTGEVRAVLYSWGEWLAIETVDGAGYLWIKDDATQFKRLGKCLGATISNHITNPQG